MTAYHPKLKTENAIFRLHQTGCPLCGQQNPVVYFKDRNRDYHRCQHCHLIFVPGRYWLSLEDEKATYDLHENDPQDPGYQKFLSRLSQPLLEKLGSKKKGLDFGCGPGPALPGLLEEHGHQVDLYDPLYANHPRVFDRQYDFITATEVVEHLKAPDKAFAALFKMLNPGGWLGMMTKLARDRTAFSRWHYIRDMTHICFYSRSTFKYIAHRFNADLTFEGNDVILLKKR